MNEYIGKNKTQSVKLITLKYSYVKTLAKTMFDMGLYMNFVLKMSFNVVKTL